MKNKKDWLTIFLIMATLILASSAVVVALRIYRLKNQPVAPTAPLSKPQAVTSSCTLSFSLSSFPTPPSTPTPTSRLTPTPTPTSRPTPTPTSFPTPTSTPTPTFRLTPTPTPTSFPSSTPTPTSILTPTSTPTSIPTPTPTSILISETTPTPTTELEKVELPVAGFDLPTLGISFAGLLMLLVSLLLIF